LIQLNPVELGLISDPPEYNKDENIKRIKKERIPKMGI
jgi:hypothetical protein